jgi:hypothetical protein
MASQDFAPSEHFQALEKLAQKSTAKLMRVWGANLVITDGGAWLTKDGHIGHLQEVPWLVAMGLVNSGVVEVVAEQRWLSCPGRPFVLKCRL